MTPETIMHYTTIDPQKVKEPTMHYTTIDRQKSKIRTLDYALHYH
jgi:hypothetical protein